MFMLKATNDYRFCGWLKERSVGYFIYLRQKKERGD